VPEAILRILAARLSPTNSSTTELARRPRGRSAQAWRAAGRMVRNVPPSYSAWVVVSNP
jgi:hypothetical protein